MKDASRAVPNDLSAAGLARPRVLIVDDLKDNRVLLSRHMRRAGYEVVEAADGPSALQAIARQPFAAVLLDVVMPGMDGFEVLRLIRKQRSDRELPVIMATVLDGVQDVVQALREGANDYIVKPIDFTLLKVRMEAQIQRNLAEACVRQSNAQLEGLVDELRTALSEAEEAARSKANFVADLSHEIRTPLNGVLGVSKALAATVTDARQRQMLAAITDSAQALERLVSGALELARGEVGALEIRQERFDLAALVERCAGLFQPLAVEKGLSFEIEIAPEARVWVVGDWLRLQQILSNLINNAVKFTSQGGVRCTVTADPEGGFRFDVRDTGVGFDASIASQLFDRFKQADSTVAPRFGGSGLGLAISKQLAQLMGGRITASSRPLDGALFSLFLPLAAAEAAEAVVAVESADQAAIEPAGRRARILLADDHPTNRLVVELLLQASNMDLVNVENGDQALAAFRAQSFDCILMDVEMPVMDGLSAIAEIRSHEAKHGAGRTPILALSAHASEEHRARSLAAGADGHLTKPLDAKALLGTLARTIGSERGGTGADAADGPERGAERAITR